MSKFSIALRLNANILCSPVRTSYSTVQFWVRRAYQSITAYSGGGSRVVDRSRGETPRRAAKYQESLAEKKEESNQLEAPIFTSSVLHCD